MIKENNARSFIPIAEGYLKSGMIDEAISVLKAGIQVNPRYLGARVSLGKAYLEKGKIDEALKEFEYAVKISPDNIFAHRKLITIYRDMGRIDDAIKSCETLLVFNPKDKEINTVLIELRKERTPAQDLPHPHLNPLPEGEETSIPFLGGDRVEVGFSEPAPITDEFSTETMGDLLIAQGEINKGIDIYKRILERDPDNESIKEKIENNLAKIEIKHRQINRLEKFLDNVERNKR
ncbi:MAG: tetratricopeptide repeat protein [Nitrospirae bacterium]|nr:tetratricopeptide repeat protein [Nitrospirota bacterium]